MPQMNVMEPVDLFPDLFWLKETVSYEGGQEGGGEGSREGPRGRWPINNGDGGHSSLNYGSFVHFVDDVDVAQLLHVFRQDVN